MKQDTATKTRGRGRGVLALTSHEPLPRPNPQPVKVVSVTSGIAPSSTSPMSSIEGKPNSQSTGFSPVSITGNVHLSGLIV